jgi:hypothetical protein
LFIIVVPPPPPLDILRSIQPGANGATVLLLPIGADVTLPPVAAVFVAVLPAIGADDPTTAVTRSACAIELIALLELMLCWRRWKQTTTSHRINTVIITVSSSVNDSSVTGFCMVAP